MRRSIFLLATSLVFIANCCKPDNPDGTGEAWRNAASQEKLSGITYQINVYSFADSDGDGWGDLKGITQHLDYLDELGATALWLSPIQSSDSYHGYNVLDYYTINGRLGTEADFRDLIDKAKQRNIGIYIDYVLNHSGQGAWFRSAINSEDSPYRSFYVLSSNPTADVAAGKIDNYAGATNPGMGAWHLAKGGNLGYKGRLHFKVDMNAKTVTVTETTEAAQNPNTNSPKCWLWYGSISQHCGLYTTASNVYEITIDIDTSWGFIVCTSNNWAYGTKYGGDGGSITFGQPFKLNNSTAADITFGGDGIWFFGSFDKSMPDLNYGPYATAATSPAFKELAKSADKWIDMGIAGLRLDAVAWIYQNQTKANVSFLKQWYDRCNNDWKARGNRGDIYMVGEAWCDNAEQMAPYYEGLPSNFNFYYWWTLKDRLNKGKGDDFARTVLYFHNLFRRYRSDFIDAIKLSNHDEDRAGSDLNRDQAKMKLAGAVLLTSPGKPFIYQGEELGYWGRKDKGDEYIRTPIKWNRSGAVPSAGLGGKVDNAMLTEDMSVEAQLGDATSVLSVYRRFAKARNEWKALAKGEMEEISSPKSSVALWTMSYEGQTVLVAHNFGSSSATISLENFKFDKTIVSNYAVSVNDTDLTLGPYASAVYLQ